jgi:hypothetical protein
MSQKTLEKVLEHLLNHEQEAAGELLHNYFVEKGRGIYESMIQTDEQIEEEIGGDPVNSFEEEVMADHDEIEEEEMFSEEEGDEPAIDMDGEMHADMDSDADHDAAADAPEGDEVSSVQDAMMDVEDAISALKAEFDKLVSGEESEDHEAGENPAEEEDEEALGEAVELKKVAVTHGDNSDAGAKDSPMTASFKKFDTGAAPAKFSGGTPEAGGKAGAPKANPNSPATTEPNVKPATKPTTTDGSDKSAKSAIAGK